MPLKGHGKKSKNLFPFYDPGVDANDDVQSFVNSQREHNHRTRQPVATVTTKSGNPNSGGNSPTGNGGGNITGPPGPPGINGRNGDAGPPGKDGNIGPDRLHKTNGVDYIFVGKDHYPLEDPVINPGYRTVGAPFSSITDALTYAQTVVIPKLADPTQRVSIFVIGGTWNEDVTINTSIKLIGLGRPLITGRVIINPADDVLLANFEIFYQSIDARFPLAALTIGLMPDTGDVRPNVVLENIWCRSTGDGFHSQSRFWANNCRFFCENNAQGFAVNISFKPGWKRFAEFTNCHFYGYKLVPYPLSPRVGNQGYRGTINFYTNTTGGAIKVTSRTANGAATFYDNLTTAGTGVVLFGCQVFGFAQCECWALGHYDTRINGGSVDTDGAGTIYCTQVSNSAELDNTDSEVWFMDCTVKAKVISAHEDSTSAGGARNYTKITSTSIGSDEPLVTANAAVVKRGGNGYVTCVDVKSDAAHWYDAGVSGSNMFIYDSMLNIPHIALHDPYYP